MIVQRPDYLAVIREAGQRGKKVAVGGPYATAFSQEVAASGADYLVLDEASTRSRSSWRPSKRVSPPEPSVRRRSPTSPRRRSLASTC